MRGNSDRCRSLAAILGLCVFASISVTTFAQDRATQQELNKEIVQEMKRFADATNPTLPRQIGAGVLLEKITVGPGVLINFHSLLTSRSSRDIDTVGMNGTVRQQIKDDICTHADVKPLLQYGARLVYTLRANDGIALSSLRFDRTDCGYPMLRP